MSDRAGFVFVEVGPGGLLLNLSSGVVFQLNDTAAFVWRLWLEGRAPIDISEDMVARYGIEAADALADVERTLDASMSASRMRTPGDFDYQRSETGYVHAFRGRPVLEVDTRGERVRALAPRGEGDPSPAALLHALVPKILALRGWVVLHASAVILGGGVIAFPGKSGAGKTTTARALAASGARLVSEDLLLLKVAEGTVEGLLGGERAIDDWVAATAPQLFGGHELSCTPLDDAWAGPSIRLTELAFVDASRRDGSAFRARPLDAVNAATECFHHTFHGADTPTGWSRQLIASAAIGRAVGAFELTSPSGLDALRLAASVAVRDGSLRS